MRSRAFALLLVLGAAFMEAGAQDAALAGGDPADPVAAFVAALDPPPAGAMPFVERRMSPLLAEPIEVRGELRLGRDGVIDKRITSPVEERVQITARTVTLERRGRSRTLDVGGDPRWQAFHAGITGLMNRDPAGLNRVFTITLEQRPDGWTLELRPRTPGDSSMVRLITASGTGTTLLGLRLDQGEGEWQEMTFPQARN